jgi:integrase
MASISTNSSGCAVQFLFAGKRHTVSVGKLAPDRAEAIKAKIEFILQDKENGQAHETDTQKWIRSIGDKLHGKLASIGLFAPRASAKQTTLGVWIDRCIARDTKAKPASKEVWRQGRVALVNHFGTETPIASITAGASDEFKLALEGTVIKSRAKNPDDAGAVRKLAPMTVRKRLQFAKKVFRAAARHKLIEENPFDDVKIEASAPDKMHFVTTADTIKLLAAVPLGQAGGDWRTIIALARWGGMRSPSEVLSLKLADIDWEHGRIHVTSPKTEHHPGKGMRVMPLFPELREFLLAASEAAPAGAVFVVNERFRRSTTGPQGWRNSNLRTTFEKIVKRAGLTPWPRLFHNLRSSRQTELQEIYPTHVVCAWLGNSPDIAREHYLQVTDAHFEKATSAANSLQYEAVTDRKGQCGENENAAFTDTYDQLRTCTTVHADGEGFDKCKKRLYSWCNKSKRSEKRSDWGSNRTQLCGAVADRRRVA